jgi:ribosomal protein S18 acetylase RimI-like enzyme
MELLRALICGYVSDEKYEVSWQDNAEKTSFSLELVHLKTPYMKQFELEPLEHYQAICSAGFSLAAYDEQQIVAIALAEPRIWNKSLWIHEFHVMPACQGKGIGRALTEALVQRSRAANLRIMTCETQNTNLPAIRFYRKMGFAVEGLDLSLYSNHDWPDGEIALWLKRRIG